MNEEYQDKKEESEEVHEERKLFSTVPPVTAAFVALIGIFILYQVGGAILTLSIFGFNLDKADVNALRLLTVGGQLLLILFPTLLLAKMVYQEGITEALRVKLPRIKEIGLFTVGLFLLIPLLQNYLYLQNFLLNKSADLFPFIKKAIELFDQLDKMMEKTYGSLLKSRSIFEASFVIFVVAVIPALCEETLFRGLVQKSFEQKFKPLFSALITAIFFGLYHFNPYGLVALIALGLYFGFAAYTSNSIFIPILLHLLNNLFAVLAFLILGDAELISTSVSKSGEQIIPHLVSFVLLSFLFVLFIIYLKRVYSKQLQTNRRAL